MRSAMTSACHRLRVFGAGVPEPSTTCSGTVSSCRTPWMQLENSGTGEKADASAEASIAITVPAASAAAANTGESNCGPAHTLSAPACWGAATNTGARPAPLPASAGEKIANVTGQRRCATTRGRGEWRDTMQQARGLHTVIRLGGEHCRVQSHGGRFADGSAADALHVRAIGHPAWDSHDPSQFPRAQHRYLTG